MTHLGTTFRHYGEGRDVHSEKKIGGKIYHYLVKSVRVGDRVQQKVLAYLGEHDNLEAAWK